MSPPDPGRHLANIPFMHRGIHPVPQRPRRPGTMERLSTWAFPTSPESLWQLFAGGVGFVVIVVAVLFLPLVLP